MMKVLVWLTQNFKGLLKVILSDLFLIINLLTLKGEKQWQTLDLIPSDLPVIF